ncbi:hypothetical protein ADH75_01045 [Flavonifractor plautii]|nr:hypothetical protein A4U99_18775 [Flavonifractor plautii]OXE48200.1 hypothetical protein ADH75_01045 [Flavonifractor plautii]
MGIGVQGEPSAEVSQHPGYRFHVHPVLEGQGGKGVPLRYNSDKRKKPLFSRGLSVCRHLFNSLGQFTRDYTQTVKRAADNKRRYAPGKGHSAVLLWGNPKGATPLLAHDFA